MLKHVIKLNPYFRLTAQECLTYKVFDPYRAAKKERILVEMQRRRREKGGILNSPPGFTPCWNNNINSHVETPNSNTPPRKDVNKQYFYLNSVSQEPEEEDINATPKKNKSDNL